MTDDKTTGNQETPIAVGPRTTGVNVFDAEGNLVGNVPYGSKGIIGDETVYQYQDKNGNTVYTKDELELPTSIRINPNTGNIEIRAPKAVTDSDMFKQTFNEEQLKAYSQAYKLNPDYKIPLEETNQETGEVEEKSYTIPEFVEKLNSSLDNYMSNLRALRKYKKKLVSKYGLKANNLTDEQVQMSTMSDGTSIWLPDAIFSISSFGNGKGNFFSSLKDKMTEDGLISIEELGKVYTADNIGRDEIAAILALIDGTLKGSTWDTEETLVDDEGKEYKNANSATEAAKILALRDYIVSHNPHAEWWQQAGQAIESTTINAANSLTQTFANLANLGETVITAGNGTTFQQATAEMDEAMEYFNTNNALVWDGVANAEILGTLGGYLLGSAAIGQLGKATAVGVGKASSALSVKLGAEAAAALGLEEGSSAAIALTGNTLYQIAKSSEKITAGVRLVLASLNLAERAAFYTNMAITGISGIAKKNIILEYLFDTIHDAILYDFDSLRGVMTELAKDLNDQNRKAALEYWGGQFLDNAKWWVPSSIAKASIKAAGKTALGKAANVVLTKYFSKWRAAVGDTVQNIRNNAAGGSVVEKLQKQLDKLKDQNSPKADRIKNKIRLEEFNNLRRQALKDLGDVKLEWDGVKLTAESAEEFKKFLTQVKQYEHAIDLQRGGVEAIERQMDGLVMDPSTGRVTYINPELGGASSTAMSAYYRISELARKYGLKATSETLWNPDMVKYFVGSQHYNIMSALAEAGGEHAAEAMEAAGKIADNVALASSRLPEEVRGALDELLRAKIYQNYYKALNAYGVSHGLLEKSRIEGYEANPIWAENGYMPAIVKKELQGRWVDSSGRIDNIIEQEMEHFIYKVETDQEYVDPELVRLTRRRTMASAEISKDLWDTYNTPGSSATNIVKVSGDQTEYATRLKENMDSLRSQVQKQAKSVFRENNIFEVSKVSMRTPVKDAKVSQETLGQVVSSLSPSETADYLSSNAGGNVLKTPDSKLTDGVTAENYSTWYASQTKPVRNYLQTQKTPSVADNKYVGLGREDLDKEIAKTTSRISELSKEVDVVNRLEVDVGTYVPLKKSALEEAIWRQKRQTMSRDLLDMALTGNRVDPTNKLEDVIAELQNGPKTRSLEAAVESEKRATKTIIPEKNLEAQVELMTLNRDLGLLTEARKAEDFSFEDLLRAIEDGGNDFEAGLQRAYLMGDTKFMKSSFANEAARNLADGKDAFYQGVFMAKMKGEMKKLLGSDADTFVDDVVASIRGQVDDLVAGVMSTSGVKDAAKVLGNTSDGANDIARYMILQELAKSDSLKEVKNSLREELTNAFKGKKLDGDVERKIANKVDALVDDIVENELAEATLVAKTLNSDLVDNQKVFKEVKSLSDKVKSAEKKVADKSSDWVIYLDDQGRKSFAQVDPAFASLYKYRYTLGRGEASALAKANALMSKAFRYGTTSVNLASFGNQLFRDFGNALLVGGAWDTIKHNADNLVDVFGRTIVEQIKAFTPDGYEERQLQLFAENTGQTLEEAAVSRELMRGSAFAASTTETSLYKGLMKRMQGESSEAKLGKMKNKLQEFVDKWNLDDLANGKRENYLRNRVYAHSLNEALENGYTLQQARAFANFAMSNATTNFGRQLYHLQAIADSTPYFSAAINGTKSFWRMWALDPVGISGRVMGGLVLPVMMLTGASLATEEDRKAYKNIPEYTKADNLVFVVNGNAMSIPLPQEISNLVAPFRQFVEYLHGANESDFWELMMNDLLGFSPVDLQGFTAVDYNKMISDPTFFDRVSRGTSRVFSQMAPVPMKSAYMLATGVDPYTGKNLRDKSYMYYNEETGSPEVMTYEENSFAKWIAELWGDFMSPELAEKIVSGIVGTTGSNLLGDLTAALQEGPEAGLLSAGKNIVEQATKPITVEQYNLVDSYWNQAVRQLTAEKKAIISSEEWGVLNKKINETTDPEARKKVLAQRQDLIDNFQQRVGDMVKRLSSEYEGTFDRKKFAAVISLLNFDSEPGYASGNQYSIETANNQFLDGRNAAIHTMQQLGVTGTDDFSIFGYLATDASGQPVVKYTSPVAIMDMKNQWTSRNDIHTANIKALVKENDLWNRHEAMEQQIDAIYSKGNLSDSDYDQIDAIYVNWNAQVMAALAPYIEEMTPEAAINNTSVMDYLDSLIEVPGDYKKDKYGRYVTNSKLGNGSANAAYIKNYIKNIFKVNDTGYSSGKNYSDRQEYIKEYKRWREKRTYKTLVDKSLNG